MKYYNIVIVLKDSRAITITNYMAETANGAYQYALNAESADKVSSISVSEREPYSDTQEGIAWEDVDKLIKAYDSRAMYREDTASWDRENDKVCDQIKYIMRKAGKL